ncbi:hypothetical protein FACS189491_03330 [Spirochaetia bacterium]|nr:hypothetical protein FACS189491_03330 [Spirochaetia bacterium]
MGENQVIVPEIPEAVKNKIFSASDIKWVKNVNDDDPKRGVTYCSAYIPQDPRVITNANGIFFYLQLNQKLRGFKNNLLVANIGDLILLHQKLNNQQTKCFTHLVTPVDNNVILKPYNPNNPVEWPGRLVKVIAMTENQAGKSIPLISTDWHTMQFTGDHYDLSYNQGRIRGIAHNQQVSNQQLSKLQNNIWNKFQQGGWLK